MIPGPIQKVCVPIDQALDLAEVYSSAEDYKARTGKDAPPFDPKRNLQQGWEITDAVDEGDGTYSYAGVGLGGVNQDGTEIVHVGQIFIAVEYARHVNLMTNADRLAYAGQKFATQPVPRRPPAVGESVRLLAGQFGTGVMPAVYVLNDALAADWQAQHGSVTAATGNSVTNEDRAQWQRIEDKVNAIGRSSQGVI